MLQVHALLPAVALSMAMPCDILQSAFRLALSVAGHCSILPSHMFKGCLSGGSSDGAIAQPNVCGVF